MPNYKPKSPKIKKKPLKVSITKKQSCDYEMIASAYHEASHTIAALANFVLIDAVRIAWDKGGDTFYSIQYHADETEDPILKKLIVMAELRTIYAGLVGEKIYYKQICGSNKFPAHLKIGSSSDMKVGSDLIRRYKLANPGKETHQLKQDVRQDMEKFLYKHWETVKLLAHTLYRKKKLNFTELKYLLTRAKEDKDFWKDKFKRIKMIYEAKSELSEKVVKNLISSKYNR